MSISFDSTSSLTSITNTIRLVVFRRGRSWFNLSVDISETNSCCFKSATEKLNRLCIVLPCGKLLAAIPVKATHVVVYPKSCAAFLIQRVKYDLPVPGPP